jgi:hypothetical protein
LPIKIENGDSRYVEFKCSDASKNNFDYFSRLNDMFTDDFYTNLHNYFKSFDISTFNPRVIPITDLKNRNDGVM